VKRAVFVYSAVLLGLFGILSVWTREGDYAVEKKAWKIYKRQVDIAKDPIAVPQKTFERIAGEYTRLIHRHPHSRLTPGLYIRLGEIYALKEDYKTARETFHKVIELYPGSQELSAEAMFQIGKTYEFNQNWTDARNVYSRIITDYPRTDTALSVPIYIASYYKSQNDFQKAIEAYEAAIKHYAKTASDHENTRIGLNALRYLSNCYLDQNRWTEAMDTLGRILEKYAASEYLTVKNVDMMIRTINVVAAYQLKDYDAAVQLYQGIIDRNPGHPLQAYLRKVIGAFHQLREKGVQVSDRK
jgi:tetratricopeptide (TPR) repeat protein